MTEAIMLVMWFGTVMFFVCREIKKNDERKSREYYLSELQHCLRSIEHEFQERCKEIIINAFSGRNVRGRVVVDKYREEIAALKKEYTDCLFEKAGERMKRSGSNLSIIPDYLVEEYERNLFEMSHIFNSIGDCMLEQIKDTTKNEIKKKEEKTWTTY